MPMQELQLSGGGLKLPTISEACTPHLRRLCSQSRFSEDGIREILNDPEAHREACEKWQVFAAMSAPAGAEGVQRALQPLLLWAPPKDIPADPDPAMDAGLKQAWFGLAYDALEDIPYSALSQAVADYIRTSEYKTFPAFGTLRKHAERYVTELSRLAYRTRRAASMKPRAPTVQTDEERAAVLAGLKDLARNLGGGGGAMAAGQRHPYRSPQEMAAALRAGA